jgi:hypothetical protein
MLARPVDRPRRQVLPGIAAQTPKAWRVSHVILVSYEFSAAFRGIFRRTIVDPGMEGKLSIPVRHGPTFGVDCDPILCFADTDRPDPRPRLLVDRLLYTRALLQTNPVLAPRFQLGACAAAHHIALGNAMIGVAAADRLMAFGFRVEPSTAPSGIRFFVSSSHSEAEIHALLVAITIAVRELAAADGAPAPGAGCPS